MLKIRSFGLWSYWPLTHFGMGRKEVYMNNIQHPIKIVGCHRKIVYISIIEVIRKKTNISLL